MDLEELKALLKDVIQRLKPKTTPDEADAPDGEGIAPREQYADVHLELP